MDWKTFVHEIILKEFSYVNSLSVTENFKNRLRLHLIDLETALVMCEQKKFWLFFDRMNTWSAVEARLNIYYTEKVQGLKLRRFKSPTERRLDDSMHRIVRQLKNRCSWFLTGTVGQRSAVLQELIKWEGVPK